MTTSPERFICQTEGCGQPFRLITLDVEDSHTDYECMGCYLARNLAILQQMESAGLIDGSAHSAQPV